MIIRFINNDGGGGINEIRTPAGTTVGNFIRQHMPGFNSGRHQVRVNREAANVNQVLEDRDHVAVMPTKVGGGS